MEIKERITVTKEMVETFAEVSGDANPIHLSKEVAAQSIFGKPIAHGILLASFFSKLIAMNYPGPGSIYLSQSLEFAAPCFVDEDVEVIIRLQEQQGKIYFLETLVQDISGKTLVKGNAKILKKEILS
ncbi:MAG: MaoC family dehydratase [Chitinophagaceae bacterium]|nr:MaoC family dehydratase [Chitinophagaceae bacterium]